MDVISQQLESLLKLRGVLNFSQIYTSSKGDQKKKARHEGERTQMAELHNLNFQSR